MPRRNPVAVDAENEARFRAYLEVVPAYLLDPPDKKWIRWICPEDDETSVFIAVYGAFGVDKHGSPLTSPPDKAKGLNRRWCALPYKRIADRMRLTVPRVKRATESLVRKGFIDVVLVRDDNKSVPHFCMNWDRVLSVVIDSVEAEDPIKQFIRDKTNDDGQKSPKKDAQTERPKRTKGKKKSS